MDTGKTVNKGGGARKSSARSQNHNDNVGISVRLRFVKRQVLQK